MPQCVYIFPATDKTFMAVNYDEENTVVNDFLLNFSINGKSDVKMFNDSGHVEFWFEISKDFWHAFHSEAMGEVFQRMHSKLVFTYPFVADMDKVVEQIRNVNVDIVRAICKDIEEIESNLGDPNPDGKAENVYTRIKELQDAKLQKLNYLRLFVKDTSVASEVE